MKKLITCLLALLSACHRPDPTPSTAELLTSKTWRLTTYRTKTTVTSGGSSQTRTYDDYALMPACQRDNTYRFGSDQTLLIDEGASKCFSFNPQTTSAQWEFDGDLTHLLITPYKPVLGADSQLMELSATTLLLRRTYTNTTGSTTENTVADLTFVAVQ